MYLYLCVCAVRDVLVCACVCVCVCVVRYGSERSGLVCALLNVVDLMQRKNQVDVFNAVKLVRQSRPQFISNVVSDSIER